MLARLLLLPVGSVLSGVSTGSAMECARVSTAVEAIICADPGLAEADRQLNAA